jgi:hypothetical protein
MDDAELESIAIVMCAVSELLKEREDLKWRSGEAL